MNRNSLYAVVAILFIWPAVSRGAEQKTAPLGAVQPKVMSGDTGQWRRDPFAGKTKKVSTGLMSKTAIIRNSVPVLREEEINLQGIIRSDRTFHALINGRVVKTGNTIRGVTIKEISRYQVVTQNEKKEQVIYDIYQGRIDRGKK